MRFAGTLCTQWKPQENPQGCHEIITDPYVSLLVPGFYTAFTALWQTVTQTQSARRSPVYRELTYLQIVLIVAKRARWVSGVHVFQILSV